MTSKTISKPPLNASRQLKEGSFWDTYWKERRTHFQLCGTRAATGLEFVASNSIDVTLHLGKRVLELGCGDGTNTPIFENVIYTGIDRSKIAMDMALRSEMLGNDTKFHRSRNFKVHDFKKRLPFEEGSFDFVFGIETFHTMGDRIVHCMRDIHRVLSPGGMLQFDILYPGRERSKSYRSKVKTGVATIFTNHDGRKVATCNERDIETLTKKCGFTISDMVVWRGSDIAAELFSAGVVGPDRLNDLMGLFFDTEKSFTIVQALRKG